MVVYAVSLLSGGLDSTTVTTYAREHSDNLTGLTFEYGQTHSKEVQCASRIAGILGIQHRVVDISFIRELAWYSALTNPDAFNVPRGSTDIGTSIPITYVPLRNTIFISMAAALLESTILSAIEVDGINPRDIRPVIYLAPNAIDYSGYPDCRPEYYDQVKSSLHLGSKIGASYDIPFEIQTPIIELSKAEIVKMALTIEAPIEQTWSCYLGGDAPCGECDSCQLRAKGFEEANAIDPALSTGP